jgi:hypothetical protein
MSSLGVHLATWTRPRCHHPGAVLSWAGFAIASGWIWVKTGQHPKKTVPLGIPNRIRLKLNLDVVDLYVAHYNFCRVHETLTPDARHQNTPAMAIGIATHVWSIGELLDAALAVAPAMARRRNGSGGGEAG